MQENPPALIETADARLLCWASYVTDLPARERQPVSCLPAVVFSIKILKGMRRIEMNTPLRRKRLWYSDRKRLLYMIEMHIPLRRKRLWYNKLTYI